VSAFDLDRCLEILDRTPRVLRELLASLPDAWTRRNEGGDTSSPYDVVGHLIHAEKTDWLQRAEIILSASPDKRFVPFDRLAQFGHAQGPSIETLIEEFGERRRANLERLRARRLTDADLDRTGIHPEFGAVTLRQLLSTWVVHDLDHLVQISRVMAKQLTGDVGPWVAYLRVVREG
jgi:hypothetical protein